MRKSLSPCVLLAVTTASILTVGGCPPEGVPAANDDVVWLAQPSSNVAPGQLKVDIGRNRIAAPGEVFWLPAEVGGGTLPYRFTWTCCSVATGGEKPLIRGGDCCTPCVTVYDTCHLRVTVFDGNGETATAEIKVTVPD